MRKRDKIHLYWGLVIRGSYWHLRMCLLDTQHPIVERFYIVVGLKVYCFVVGLSPIVVVGLCRISNMGYHSGPSVFGCWKSQFYGRT